jgi:NADPH2:quinone reductase
MKAIRINEFGGPEVMRLEEMASLHPGPGQVVVTVEAVGVNPVDCYIRAGLYGERTFPFTPGLDAAGVVAEIGPGVIRFKAGDRVYAAGTQSGAYAEQALCNETQLHTLPPNASYTQGAALGVPYATAYRALFQRARAVPGETVLIHGGTGGVGTASIQWARAAGLTVIATGGTERGRALAKEQGAHHVLDHHTSGYLEQLLQLTGGRGVDVIVEFLANVNLGNDLPLLAPGGRVAVVGSRGPVEINPRDAMGRDASVIAMSLFNASPRELAIIHAAIGAGLENGTIRPVIGRELPLAEAAQAHEAVMAPGAYGKIVLLP